MNLIKEKEKDNKTLTKENKRLQILIIIFMVIAVCLGTFYFNVICFGAGCENKTPKPLVIINSDKTSTDSKESENSDVAVADLEKVFKKVYEVRTSSNAYCGKSVNSDKTQSNASGLNYYVSTTYSSYSTMIDDLTKYATDEVLNIKKDQYIEENGKLYCVNDGKGSMCEPTDYTIEIVKKEENIITANVVVDLTCGNFNEESHANETFTIEYTKNGDNWIISKYNKINN